MRPQGNFKLRFATSDMQTGLIVSVLGRSPSGITFNFPMPSLSAPFVHIYEKIINLNEDGDWMFMIYSTTGIVTYHSEYVDNRIIEVSAVAADIEKIRKVLCNRMVQNADGTVDIFNDDNTTIDHSYLSKNRFGNVAPYSRSAIERVPI